MRAHRLFDLTMLELYEYSQPLSSIVQQSSRAAHADRETTCDALMSDCMVGFYGAARGVALTRTVSEEEVQDLSLYAGGGCLLLMLTKQLISTLEDSLAHMPRCRRV